MKLRNSRVNPNISLNCEELYCQDFDESAIYRLTLAPVQIYVITLVKVYAKVFLFLSPVDNPKIYSGERSEKNSFK